MKKINLPENILTKDNYNMLHSLQKGEFIHNVLKQILHLNPLGVTISDITKNTYFSRGIVWHHLEMLSSKGECLRIERGDIDVYHLNAVINSLEEFDILDDNSEYHFSYNFDLVENPFGKFLRVQRLRGSRSDAHKIRAGVIIPYHLVNKIAEVISKIRNDHITNK